MDKLTKPINVKGEIIEMTFEECYSKFENFRLGLAKKYLYMAHHDFEDVCQLVDMFFYKAYLKYDLAIAGFMGYVTKYVAYSMMRINRAHNTQKRQSYKIVSSLNVIGAMDEESEIINLITDKKDVAEIAIFNVCLEKVLNSLEPNHAKISKLLLLGFTQQEIANALNTYQSLVSRIKRKFLSELKKELSA